MNEELINNVRTSFGRCTISNSFFDDFYRDFLTSDPCIAPMFRSTDMVTQKQLLKNGISFLIMFANNSEFAKSKIQDLAESHAHTRLNIKPEMYKYWLGSLLRTIDRHDKQSTPALLEDWKMILSAGIKQMIKGY